LTALSADNSTSIEEVLKRVLELHPRKIDLSLERILKLLGKLGDPQKKLPPVIHVAGTNGKGSVVAMTRAMLEASGYRVHVYTSPHLVRFNERIRLSGKLIDDEDLKELLSHCENVNDGDEVTFFEFITACALYKFSTVHGDVVILEVGLGGRLDATNVIDTPLVSAITPIHLDHQIFLGRTLSQIASEKAGVIKKSRPVVCAPQPVAVQAVIAQASKSRDSNLLSFGRDWHIELSPIKEDEMIYEDGKGKLTLPLPSLKGEHQIRNAGQAIAILKCQDVFNIPDAAIKAGLDWVRWPGRLQNLDDTIFAKLLPKGSAVWLDGGHNPAAARTLKAFFRDLDTQATPFYMVVGMLAGKDTHRFIKPFCSLVKALYAVPIQNQTKVRPPSEIAAEASALGISGRISLDVPSALRAISKECDDANPPTVLITGSLYLAGEVLKQIGEPLN
jgi:dihydrofolate synthase/folylpolyglutamate synthase